MVQWFEEGLSPHAEAVMQQFVDAINAGDRTALLHIADTFGQALKEVGNNFQTTPPPGDGSNGLPPGMVAAVSIGSLPPLHLAAQHGYTDVAQKLVERGADINERDLMDRTPAAVAQENGHAATAEALKANSRPQTAPTSSFGTIGELYNANRDKERDYVETWVATPLKAGEILTVTDGINDVKQGRMQRDGYQVAATTNKGTVKGGWMEKDEFEQYAAVQSRDPAAVTALKQDLPEGTKVTPVQRGDTVYSQSSMGFLYEKTADAVDGVQLEFPGGKYKYLSGLSFNALYKNPDAPPQPNREEVVFYDKRETPSKGIMIDQTVTAGGRTLEAGSVIFPNGSPDGYTIVEPDVAKRFVMAKPGDQSPRQKPELKSQAPKR